ncbi:MAG: DNA-processing protein DprA [Gaiellales bacterium]
MSGEGLRIALAGAEAGVEPAWLARRSGGAAKLARMSRAALVRMGAPEDFAAALGRARATDIGAYRERLSRGGIRCAGVDDPGYPPELLELADPPVAVFMRGAGELRPGTQRVSIVGSRRPSDPGLALTRRLARFAANRDVTVVSGLALGIDAAAHAGALEGGGQTVAVLGCGVDVVYPRTNAGLFQRVLETGLVISEYPPGTAPAPWRFPARNRLIEALAETLLVVEARARSGALITADQALDLGRDVLAVPGSPAAAGSAGTNGLLKAGAGLIEDAEDLAGWLGVEPPSAPAPSVAPELAAVLEELARQPSGADELAGRLGRSAADVAAAIVRLELDGLVIRDEAGVLSPAHRPDRPGSARSPVRPRAEAR